MNLELINPLLHYAGALDDLEDILFENEMRAFERELDGLGFEDLETIAKPVWGAKPGTLKSKRKSRKKTLKRKRARVKALPKTAQTRSKLKVKKSPKKRRAAQARQGSKSRS